MQKQSVDVPEPRVSRQLPLYVVFNVASGSGDAQQNRRTMQEVLRAAGRRHEFLLPYVRPLPAAESGAEPEAWVVQAGTAVSRRIREGVANSVNVLHYSLEGPVRCEVERWDYSAAVERFAPVMRAALSLSRVSTAAATAV